MNKVVQQFKVSRQRLILDDFKSAKTSAECFCFGAVESPPKSEANAKKWMWGDSSIYFTPVGDKEPAAAVVDPPRHNYSSDMKKKPM